jgi:hypothetical protein
VITLITPAHIHIALLILFKAGIFPTITVGEPGAQGVVVAGTQGTGVGTPSLAAVAAIKAGLVGALHIPKGMIFFIGTKSMILATGIL